jgi:2-formylbenzoate dehydrogenase
MLGGGMSGALTLDRTEAGAQLRDRGWGLLIDGQLRPAADGRTYTTLNPATEEPLAEVPDAGAQDVDAAVQAGRRAFREWAARDVRERARTLRELAAIVRSHAEELATLDALDCGHPYQAMLGDVAMACDTIELTADWAMQLGGEVIPASTTHLNYTVREPWGVVAKIIPYNHPIMFASAKLAAPLLAGNAVVLKLPHQTPLSGLRMAELFAQALPPGLLAVLSGAGPATGEALVRHPDVRRIAFIGSVPTGQAILRTAAAAGIKDVTLELGGKNAMIVYPDADLDAAAKGAVKGMNFRWSAGQSCGSTSRLLAHESIRDELLARLRAELERVRVGDPLAAETEMGCLVSAHQHAKVTRYIEAGAREGATLLHGGGRPGGERFERGYWIDPTLFADVDPRATIAREEIFGPVLATLSWREEQEALRIANELPFGLTASVWTADVAHAHRVARELEVGYVWINESSRHFAGTPFGGAKDSGLGREESVQEVLSYTQSKSVHVALR